MRRWNNPNCGFQKGHKFGFQKGQRSAHWKGGRIVMTKGYILLFKPKHPFCSKQGYVFEHRIIMEQHLGRYLKSEEKIHHKGIKYPIGSIKNKQDNRIKNLQLFANDTEHLAFHRNL